MVSYALVYGISVHENLANFHRKLLNLLVQLLFLCRPLMSCEYIWAIPGVHQIDVSMKLQLQQLQHWGQYILLHYNV